MTPPDGGDRPAAAAPAVARWRLGFACAAVLLAAADTYVVVLALPSIMRDVGLSLDQLQQAAPIVSGFLLGYVVVMPLLGRLSDLYGRRPVFVACLCAFAVGSVLTATAEALPLVVAGRTIQGLGGGGLVPVTLALVADTWPPGKRGLPLGVVGAVQELGSVLGPLYGAVIVAVSSWRTIFWINIPVAGLLGAAFLVLRSGEQRPPPGASPRSQRRLPDLVGGVLVGLAAAAGLLSLTRPVRLAESEAFGEMYSPLRGGQYAELTTPMSLVFFGLAAIFVVWEIACTRWVRPLLPLRRIPEVLRSADWPGAALLGGVLACVILVFASADPAHQVIAGSAVALLPLAVVLGTTFVWRELRCRDPLVDFPAFADRAAFGSLLTNLFVGAGLMAALVDIPIFARTTQFSNSQFQAALVLVRFLAAVPVGAVAGGFLCERIGYRLTTAAGMLLSAGMFVAMTTWTAGTLGERGILLGWRTPLRGSDIMLALCGLGFGLAIAPINAAVLAGVRAALHGLASSLVVVARMVGMLVGLSLLTAIGLRRFYDAASRIPAPDRLCPKHPIPGQCPAYDGLVTAAALDELHAIFAGAAICAVVAAALGIWLLRRPAQAAGRGVTDTLVAAIGPGG